MRNVKVEDFIKHEKSEIVIVCKEKEKKGKKGVRIDLKAGFLGLPSHLSLDRQASLIDISETGIKSFTHELIDAELENRLITGFYRGSSDLLPSRYRKFYDHCVEIRTNGLDIYFADLAIEHFQDTIYHLERRSLADGLSFVHNHIQDENIINMSLGIMKPSDSEHGRSVYYDSGSSYYEGYPKDTIYYHTNGNEDGTLDPEELANMEEMISLFVQRNGGFRSMKCSSNECVAYNRGSILVAGIDKAPQLKDKVACYVKRKNEKLMLIDNK